MPVGRQSGLGPCWWGLAQARLDGPGASAPTRLLPPSGGLPLRILGLRLSRHDRWRLRCRASDRQDLGATVGATSPNVTRDLIVSTVRKRVKIGKRLSVDIDWRKQLDREFKDATAPKDSLEDRGRHKKAAALREFSAARFSVLIGAAGTGKTTLLKFLCDAAPINQRGVLLLAPTGKARVRLQGATGMKARTIAQFLRPLRYDDATQRYRVVGDMERSSTYKTVIVDEASMLTEEQLAALVDALSAVGRIILVGDPSQLPPIGAGRPFVDIVKLLTPTKFPLGQPRIGTGYAELTIGSRQKDAQRQDLEFAELFSGRTAGPASDAIIGLLTQGDCGPHLRVCDAGVSVSSFLSPVPVHSRMVARSPWSVTYRSPRFGPGVSTMRSISPRIAEAAASRSSGFWSAAARRATLRR